MRSVILKSVVLVATLIGFAAGLPSASAQLRVFTWDKVWKYHDLGQDLGTAWKEKTYNDTTWESGAGVMTGRSDNTLNEPLPAAAYAQGAQNQTLVTLRPDGTNTARTHYFRTTFNIGGQLTGLIFTATNVLDDGAVFYVNGVEVGRLGMPAGGVTFSTSASRAQEVTDHGLEVFTFSPTNLTTTGNVLAVEVHQGGGNSSDLLMGMTLHYRLVQQVFITGQPTSQTVDRNSPFNLSVTAIGDDPMTYQWQKETTTPGVFADVSGAVSAVYSVSSAQLTQSGNYRVIVSNPANTVISQVANVQVVVDETRPIILSAVFKPHPQPAPNPYQLVVTFSEPIDFTTGRASTNYAVRNATSSAPLAGTVLGFPSTEVTLTVDPWTSGANYILRVSNVKDRSGNAIMPETEVAIGWRTLQEIFPMNKAWRYWEDGPLDAYPNWKTDNMSSLPYYGDGAAVFWFDFDFPGNLCGGQANKKISDYAYTTYFTTTFTLPTVSPNAQLELHSVVDDGAVVWLNGQEIGRYNMPAGAVDHWTPASSWIDNATCITNYLSTTNLNTGTNWLAVEVHESSNRSEPDKVFGAEMVAVLTTFPFDLEPTLSIDQANTNASISWSGQGFGLEYATNFSGPWTSVNTLNNRHMEPVSSAAQRFWRLRKR